MRKVMQTKLWQEDGIHSGNCFSACLASLLDLPLWAVPPFEDMFASHVWHERRDWWLRRFFNLQLVRLDGHPVENLPVFYIASGDSPRGVQHSTIYSGGALVHDPHFSGAGLVNVEWCWFTEHVQ